MTDEQFNRLPVFAQKAIAGLRETIARLKDQVADRESKIATALGTVTTDIEVRYYFGEQSAYLRDRSRVRFCFGPGRQQHIEAWSEGGSLMIHGGGAFVVEPVASNAVRVRLKGGAR